MRKRRGRRAAHAGSVRRVQVSYAPCSVHCNWYQNFAPLPTPCCWPPTTGSCARRTGAVVRSGRRAAIDDRITPWRVRAPRRRQEKCLMRPFSVPSSEACRTLPSIWIGPQSRRCMLKLAEWTGTIKTFVVAYLTRVPGAKPEASGRLKEKS